MPHPCFLLIPIPKIAIKLRRYHSSNDPAQKCPMPFGYHDASTAFMVIDYRLPGEGEYEEWCDTVEALRPPKDHPKWPLYCECDYRFQDGDQWQMFTERLHQRSDNGELVTIRDAAPGAMWFAWWMKRRDGSGLHGWEFDNQTTPQVIVRTPGGDWNVDGRASNCTMPNDRSHRCWVRHGEPPALHVDKSGNTCAAGAGSIIAGNYHGFLHNGALTDGC